MKILGIDFGLKRIGLATSAGQIASPWKVIEGNRFKDLVEKIKKETLGFDKVVIGSPEGKMGLMVKKVVKSLRADGVDVIEVDETLSTHTAISQMVRLNIPRKKRRTNDAYSAAIILQDYLDSQ